MSNIVPEKTLAGFALSASTLNAREAVTEKAAKVI